MRLHKNKDDFTEAVQAVSRGLNISPALIEKDYYVTLVLKRINEEVPGLIFKGGTSLSKCHKAINRFSEDIDLTLDSEHLTEGQKKIVKPTIVKICEELGLTINNLENTRSRRDYNCYQISYPLLFENDEIDPVIKAETVFIQECYPEEVKQADSLIGEWLKANGFTKQSEEYELIPFDIHVQTMERTLVDKVFALCDYMLLDDMKKHSRHIYDIYQLLKRVELNDDFRALVHRVREDRKYHSLCISAQDDADVPALLKRVIETGCYKKDYEEHTRTMLYAPCDYEEAITGLEKIIDSGMFGKDEEYERNTVHISVSSAVKIASYKEYRLLDKKGMGRFSKKDEEVLDRWRGTIGNGNYNEAIGSMKDSGGNWLRTQENGTAYARLAHLAAHGVEFVWDADPKPYCGKPQEEIIKDYLENTNYKYKFNSTTRKWI